MFGRLERKMNKAFTFTAILIISMHLLCINCLGGQFFPDKPFARLGKGSISQVAYSPDGKLLAVAGSLDIRIYDSSSLIEVGLFQVIYTMSIAFSPDGKILASRGADGTVRFWDIVEQRQVYSPQGNTFNFNPESWISPDGKIKAIGGDEFGDIILLNEQGEHIGTLQGHKYIVNLFAFSPDGKLLASGSGDGTVRIWDVAQQKQVGILQDYTSMVTSLAFSQDGRLLAAGGGKIWPGFGPGVDGSVRLWDVETQKQVGRLEHPYWYRTSYERNTSVAFSSDGKFLASGWDGGKVHFWDVQEQKQIAILEGSHIPVAFSPESEILASGVFPSAVLVAPAKSHKAQDRPIILLWNAKTQQRVGELKGIKGYVKSLAFSPDGKLLASGNTGDKNVSLWDIGTQKQVGTLQGHTASVFSLAFSPDGRTLASGGGEIDKSVRLWDVQTQKQLDVLQGHTGVVEYIAFSPDGKWLASGGGSFNTQKPNTVRLWDMETRKQVELLKAGEIYCLAISPDWKWLATGMSDGTILLWRLKIDLTETAVKPEGKLLTTMGQIKHTVLLQNYPNPFNPETWIPFELAQESDVVMRIYDAKGSLVRGISLGRKPADSYIQKAKALYWDGRNDKGEKVASGVYFYNLQAGNSSETKKMVIER